MDVGYDFSKESSVLFEVQACNDAHVALSTSRGNTRSNTYEIVIGGWGNAKSAIRRGRQDRELAFPNTPGIVDCANPRPFWISWQGGRIRLGKGHIVGSDVAAEYQDAHAYVVNYVSVSTGWGSTGQWEVYAPGEI